MPSRDLPIYELQDSILSALRACGRLIVQAPTGSGKSTQLPQMLLEGGMLASGEAVILQPRRLAARLLAKRVAEEVGCVLGDIVGYQIRLDSKVSVNTKIRFVTEGILLRQMSFDDHLKGISVLIFDEFHERHLYGDITLARALQIQQTTRPDLKIVVMSATLDSTLLKNYLAPCEILVSQGRSFPVAIEYLESRLDPDREEIWNVAAREAARAGNESKVGDLLIFMPGGFEIGRTVQALQPMLSDFIVLPLHGELSAADQDKAVERYERRKAIVSTNVAETSLTIDGVTVVIDCGLARIARFDANRGINTLLIEKISIASADQRAGRAGRTAPGRCIRLWTEREHAQRPLQEVPEVKRLDLSEVVLTLKASGVDDIYAFPWLEKPDVKALEKAETMLVDLGALERSSEKGSFAHRDSKTHPQAALLSLSEVGRRMLRFPVHPRYARMFLEADKRGCVRSVALMAAITQGRNFLIRNAGKDTGTQREDVFGEENESDFFLLMRAWRYADKNNFSLDACRMVGIHAQGARQVGPLFKQFLEIADKENLDVSELRVEGTEIRKCVLAGFADQVARRVDKGTLRCDLVHGRKGLLARESSIQSAPLLVAGEINEIEGRGGEVNVLLTLATAIEEPWLRELFPDDFVETSGVSYDETARRVVSLREKRFRDLILESKLTSEEPSAHAAAAILAKEVVAGRIVLGEWSEAVEQWIVRVSRLAEWFPELEVNPITDLDRVTLIEQICYGAYSARDLKDKPVMPVLKDWLTAEQLAVIDDYLPERLVMANGRKSRIIYAKDGPPVLSARIQELYGVEGKFTLGYGRVPVKIEVLAPNHRPIQVTDDLSAFWRDMYPKIRAEYSRRYPRHEWR